MKRREFIGALAGSAAALAGRPSWSAMESKVLPRRALGKTGIHLPVIGFSGIVARDNTPEAVARVVAESLDMGIDFFDIAASYGNSEEMLAPVLRPRRKDIILATKTRERTREAAAVEFERSCEILGTDYFDMYLVHGIQHVDRDVDAAFAKDGVMDYVLEKKRAGQIRFLGFSSHSTESALAALDRHDFDFFYFPISYVPYLKADFGPSVLAKAREKGIPCISLKSLARQRLPEGAPRPENCAKCWYEPIEELEEAALAMRWALSLPGVVSVLPPGEERLYRLALAASGGLDLAEEADAARLMAMAEDKRPLFPR